MDQEFKARWVAALRSGEYEQGQGQLVADFGDGQKVFCCLGVACEVAVEDGLAERAVTRDGFHDGYADTEGNEDNGAIPLTLAIQLGLTPSGSFSRPVYAGGRDHYGLDSLNDTAGWTFAQIADYIETNF